MQEPEALTDEQRIKAREALRDEFEQWWEREGEYLRAGGGQYEKTFAFHAWQAATERARSLLPAPSSEPVAEVVQYGASVRLIWSGVEAAHNAKPGPLYAHPPSVPAAGWQEAFVRELLWAEHPECCGQPVVGAEYMGAQEMLCCGCPEPALLTDAQIVASLRERFPEDALAAAPKAVPAADVPNLSMSMFASRADYEAASRPKDRE